jgi:glycosyltransferase involved in cell wall biosynthesis
MHKVSAVIITLNEEADIARALRSVSWCDEILVVDSGSTDRTVDICAAHGCKVIRREFTGYGEQKAFAVNQAANDWVFVLDADEEVPLALRDEILTRLESAADCRGFFIPITTILWDRVVRTQERHTGSKLRLFDRRTGNFGTQLVHESVALNGRTALLHERMYNHSYANISDYFDKFNRYTTAGALQCFLEGKRASVVAAVLRLPLTFLQLYVGRGYVRDGAIGLIWSLFSAFYPAVKYLKLWELRRAAARHFAPETLAGTNRAQRQPAGSLPLAKLPPDRNTPSRTPFWMAARRRLKLPLSICAAAVCAVAMALLWMPLIGDNVPGDYAACLLFAVLVTACVGGYRPALLATALSTLALDYFIIEPPDTFSLPGSEDVFRLALFLALSLLTISVVYRVQRRSAR